MKVWRWIFVCCLALVTVSIGSLTWVSNYHFRNFHVVEPGTLYRSGQLTPTGLDFVLQRYKIKTVVTLRAVSDPDRSTTEDLDLLEQQACENRGIKHIRIAPKVWDADERGDIAATQVVSEFQAIMMINPTTRCWFTALLATTCCLSSAAKYSAWVIPLFNLPVTS